MVGLVIGYALLLVLLWFLLTFALFCLVRRRTAGLPPVHLARVSLRAVFGAIAFAPTLAGGQMAVFPAPASLVLAIGIVVPDFMGESTGEQMRFALLTFAITAVIWFFAICGGPKAPMLEQKDIER